MSRRKVENKNFTPTRLVLRNLVKYDTVKCYVTVIDLLLFYII